MIEIENFLEKTVVRGNSPSVQYVLFDQDHIIKEFSLGLADISANKKVSDTNTYNAFSVTKTFTAIAVLQLAEMKKLDIELPVRIYLPTFPYSPDITVRQLLSHSAGIPNPIPLSWIHLTSEHQTFDRNNFFTTIFNKHNKTVRKPNQKFGYSNLGYVLLGQLIERVTGMSYEQYVTENIIRRIKINSNDLGFEIPDAQLHAKGYHKKLTITNLILGVFMEKSKFMGKAEGKWKRFNSFYVNGVSYGGLIGTRTAFVTYIQHLLKAESPLLSYNYKKSLFTENYTTDGKPTGMCLSWFTGQVNGNKYYAHAGGGGGYYCEIRLYSDKGIGSVIFFNRTGMSDERFLDKVDRLYFQQQQTNS